MGVLLVSEMVVSKLAWNDIEERVAPGHKNPSYGAQPDQPSA